jgi:hypothetical protein
MERYERYLTGLVALLLLGAMTGFFMYIPIFPIIAIALILVGMVLMFFLGLYVGINVDLRRLAQVDPMPLDAGNAAPREHQSGRTPMRPGEVTGLAASTCRVDSPAPNEPENVDSTVRRQDGRQYSRGRESTRPGATVQRPSFKPSG